MKRIFLVSALFLISINNYCQISPDIFTDDFNSNQINTDIWYTDLNIFGGDPSTANGNVSCSASENVILANGNCELRITNEYVPSCYVGASPDHEEKFYKTGTLISKRKFKYGIFQARIKIDVTNGTWPAFWLFGEDVGQNYRVKGEIDVFEINGFHNDKFNNNWHHWHSYQIPVYDGNGNLICDNPGDYCVHQQDSEIYDMNGGNNSCNSINVNGTIDQWHNYKVIWGPNYIAYYLDENLIRIEYVDLPESMHLIISTNANIFPNPIDPSPCGPNSSYLMTGAANPQDFPSSMYIDWVTVTPWLQCEDLAFCNYYQNWGNLPTSYYAEKITAGGTGCVFSFDQTSPTAALDAMDFRATETITLKPGFRAHSELNTDQYGISRPSIFTAGIVQGPSICDFDLFGIQQNGNSSENIRIHYSEDKKIINQLMPNPAQNYLKILLTENKTDIPRELEIFNSVGELVKTLKALDDNINVDLFDIPNGMYIIIVGNAHGIETRRFIVRK